MIFRIAKILALIFGTTVVPTLALGETTESGSGALRIYGDPTECMIKLVKDGLNKPFGSAHCDHVVITKTENSSVINYNFTVPGEAAAFVFSGRLDSSFYNSDGSRGHLIDRAYSITSKSDNREPMKVKGSCTIKGPSEPQLAVYCEVELLSLQGSYANAKIFSFLNRSPLDR
jgi:hypothetical protein